MKNQSSAAENGIYVVAASGAPTRASDMDGSDEFKGAFFFVEEGTVNANAGFVCTSTGTISVGSSSISFAQFSGAGSIVAGVGLDKSGNELSVKFSELTAKGANAVAGDSIAIIDSEDSDASKKLTVSNLVGLMDGTGLTASSGVLSVDASQTQITAVGTIATGEWQATDVAVAHGGTGASSASGARTNLGLVIGSDVQAYDAELAAIAGLTSAANKGIQFTGSGQAATYDLTAAGKALLDDADAAAQRTTMGVAIGSDVQAYHARLADISGLDVTDGGIIVGDGSNFVLESGSVARASLGLSIGSDVQAYDAELAAIAGLTSAADKGIQFTGSGQAATYDLTAAGKALLDDANAAAQRVTMGVEIGVDVQAYDAELAALAGLTSAADKGIQFTGSGQAATFDLTAAGKALLDDADAAAQRTTLGLVIGTDVLAQQAIGIANDNLVEMDDADAESGDFARFTANGLEGREASEVRGDLSLVPGTDVQAYDAGLASIASLTTSADKMIYTSGSDTYAVTSLTSAGRAILDDASASAQRDTLGLQPKVQFFSGLSTSGEVSITLDSAVGSAKGIIVFVNGAAKMMALDTSGNASDSNLSAADSEKFYAAEGSATVKLGSDLIDDSADFVIVWYMA